ncbi:hypothetical protein FO519_008488 [Halicephalobus sp. NKZ332]|nr:hypothetical protein FO519_008488 [Halicephalobus sp. NKZ332]
MKEFIKNSEAYTGRPTTKFMRMFYGGNYGLVFSDFWKSQRRFLLHVLRELGVGKSVLEGVVIDYANEMTETLRQLNGEPIDMMKMLTTVVGNIVHKLTFGWTVPLESDYIIDIRNRMQEIIDMTSHPMKFLMQIWDGFRILDPLFNGIIKECLKKNDVIINDIRKEIKKHRDTIDYNSEPRDYIDAFLMEQRRQKEEIESDGEWSDKQLIGAVYDLFGGAIDTTPTSIKGFLLYMVNYPEVQNKIHEEIDREIGRERNITMSDQAKLPYLQACIQELQRIFIPFSLNTQHMTTEDVVIGGYKLPKGTVIIPQFHSVHFDEYHFNDPERFDPTRHLDTEGRFVKDNKIIPFSLGKRVCPGENVARVGMFLIIANLFQKFKFKEEIDGKYSDIRSVSKILCSPDSFYTRVIYRG